MNCQKIILLGFIKKINYANRKPNRGDNRIWGVEIYAIPVKGRYKMDLQRQAGEIK